MNDRYILGEKNLRNLKIYQLDNLINDISKISVQCEIMNWFQQSPLHWMMGLFVMKYYYLDSDLSKQQLVEEINMHITTDGKKTITTEFRYIEDCENKKYITTLPSPSDHRKKNVRPTEATINSYIEWLEQYNTNMRKIIEKSDSLTINN